MDGPLPDIDPDVSTTSIVQGRARIHADPLKVAAEWRAQAEAEQLSIRDVVIRNFGRLTFVGTPSQVAQEMNDFVQADGSDGFVLAPHLTPTGLDRFVDSVVPLLQERGVLRTEYTTTTLRGHLGLPAAGEYGAQDAATA